jgi:hypothetical protein
MSFKNAMLFMAAAIVLMLPEIASADTPHGLDHRGGKPGRGL